MYEELLVKHCSPTLAGLKTANAFRAAFADVAQLHQCLREWNQIMTEKGLRAIPLHFEKGRALIYVFRPVRLEAELRRRTARRLLIECGYDAVSSACLVVELKRRLARTSDFPHEIGLFLGYPAEDVRGFIENRAKAWKLCGFWKVYGDVNKAQKTFEKYRKCIRVYARQYAKKPSIQSLIVPERLQK